ncbi:C39 family peptidase [Paenibacillus koleovorans]|uniref:C39 family peptidase n=1 Tax=Paenibacillus koleovorans TaxID=121608 RepID=UPI000FDA622A|nr:C39 family peptidase [Paenibacillus koleovorans]
MRTRAIAWLLGMVIVSGLFVRYPLGIGFDTREPAEEEVREQASAVELGTGTVVPLEISAAAAGQVVVTPTSDEVSVVEGEAIPTVPVEVLLVAEAAAVEAVELPPAETAWYYDEEQHSAMHLIDVPIISQLPELYNGCEITSFAMLLAHLGKPMDKLELAELMPRDYTPAVLDENGTILEWGDPDQGFVGDVYGNDLGYGIYAPPLAQMLGELYEGGALDLTGQDFSAVEESVAAGKPVMIWNIATFAPSDAWVTWYTSEGKEVTATFQEHCVLLVGYDDTYVYINNPFERVQAQVVDKWSFIAGWEQLGSKALTYM